jgi:type III pantothenate kinase
MDALATRAAALRSVELVRPRSVIGKNTVECLQAGVLYGFAGQVDGLVRRILAELGPKAGPVTVLGTGGLAPLMMGESETITEYVPDLTLLGLRLVYLRNARTTSVTSGSSNVPDDVSGRVAR